MNPLLRTSSALAIVLAGLTLAACTTQPDTSGATGTTASAEATGSAGPSGSITVFAAASLQRTFTELGKQYEQQHPGTTITFSFAGSSDLVSQIRNGAPADVFASADEANMAKLATTDLATGWPRDFATNTLEIAVAPGNPEHVADLRDLTASDLQVVTCAAPVPCGAATAKVERAAGIELRPVSEEQSVTDVLGKVESGQADAGLVYVTDVEGSGGKVEGVPFAQSSEAVNTYPIGVLTESANPVLAASFAAYVRSDAGRAVLSAAGFGAP
ncbi:molybdate ABC transporter substrate-binding protein [Curtobacterium sp. SGAir0471]|uniref:molybdate ABC transporter substrate-binding protein n=1 Tax=Curtobacterium sp. SGAir0471 TaxID=2070337 RepID=UPI0010CCE1A0|nr:molybdate ABC transporter substrate-binding protein [Curtobacterium sp. SGAir0471]QCR44292.1 molybdate ABC transporter substrate-binding protein [Curtobacterium sp. SGAir0471]